MTLLIFSAGTRPAPAAGEWPAPAPAGYPERSLKGLASALASARQACARKGHQPVNAPNYHMIDGHIFVTAKFTRTQAFCNVRWDARGRALVATTLSFNSARN